MTNLKRLVNIVSALSFIKSFLNYDTFKFRALSYNFTIKISFRSYRIYLEYIISPTSVQKTTALVAALGSELYIGGGIQ